MSLDDVFRRPEYLAEKAEMPVMRALMERLAAEKPLKGITVVIGQLLAVNSMTEAEAYCLAGANVVLCIVREEVKAKPVGALLRALDVPVLPAEEAVYAGDYFADEAAALGRLRTPKGAAEITRTGDHVYAEIPCPVISVDRSKVKLLETFMGTGDGFVRGWRQFGPGDSLRRKRLVQFGYGKVGKGVAKRASEEGMDVTVVDVDPAACARAGRAGYRTINGRTDAGSIKDALAHADVVVGMTGIAGAVGETVPAEWLLANQPVFVNMGYNEFGPAIPSDRLLGGPGLPVNLYLSRPTLNRYIDPALAAQVMGIEQLVRYPEHYPVGVHPLRREEDRWILETWRKAWPDEDLSELREDLGDLM